MMPESAFVTWLNGRSDTIAGDLRVHQGYVQAVMVDDTIYVSGQLSHDNQGNMVGAAPLDVHRLARSGPEFRTASMMRADFCDRIQTVSGFS